MDKNSHPHIYFLIVIHKGWRIDSEDVLLVKQKGAAKDL